MPALNYFNYFTEIEETFICRRGKHLLLSPMDWALIENWKDREIPLRIVLRGIENVFDAIEKNPMRSRSVKSISYCRDEIERLYEDWLRSQVGKGSENKLDDKEVDKISSENRGEQPNLFSDAAVDEHLDRVIAGINNAQAKASGELRQTITTVSKQLARYRKTYISAEALEEGLSALESEVDKVLLDSSPPEVLAELKLEIERKLSSNKLSRDDGVYGRTLDLMLRKSLREKAGIPRLSLFYL